MYAVAQNPEHAWPFEQTTNSYMYLGNRVGRVGKAARQICGVCSLTILDALNKTLGFCTWPNTSEDS